MTWAEACDAMLRGETVFRECSGDAVKINLHGVVAWEVDGTPFNVYKDDISATDWEIMR